MSNQEARKVEEMSKFFNARADSYEEHMQGSVHQFREYYQTVAHPIARTAQPIKILDLGCGTGLEIKAVLDRAPNAQLTCIDMSQQMLNVLLSNYQENRAQIYTIADSYLSYPFEQQQFDYCIAIMTIHHFVHQDKLRLYKRIKQSLKPGGKYIEGDYVVSAAKEQELLAEYHRVIKEEKLAGLHHIDIPFTLEHQKELFQEAGFSKFELLWQKEEQVIYVVQ